MVLVEIRVAFSCVLDTESNRRFLGLLDGLGMLDERRKTFEERVECILLFGC